MLLKFPRVNQKELKGNSSNGFPIMSDADGARLIEYTWKPQGAETPYYHQITRLCIIWGSWS